MSDISSVSSVSAPAGQPTIAELQAEMELYGQFSSGPNTQATAAYKALQSAISSGNINAAEAALARLELYANLGTATPPATPADPGPTGSPDDSSTPASFNTVA